MQRTIAISDIHGCVDELNELLIRMKYTPSRDRLILLGDYVDRGPDSRGTVQRVRELVQGGAVALRGNHDQRLVDLARQGDEHTIHKFMTHGGLTTASSYLEEAIQSSEWTLGSEVSIRQLEKLRELLNGEYAEHITFLAQLPLYTEDERHLYVHAGIHPDYCDNWREQPEHEFMYVKAPFWRNRTRLSRKVLFGHTRAVEIHGRPSVYFGDDKIGIDGGCAYGQQLNGIEITSSGYAVWYVPAHKQQALKN
jgi:serine/threonine protein phosphatase 1